MSRDEQVPEQCMIRTQKDHASDGTNLGAIITTITMTVKATFRHKGDERSTIIIIISVTKVSCASP